MKSKLIILIFVLMFSTTCYAEERNWQFVEEIYDVQQSDTIDSITEMFLKKNTYGEREFKEFREGIKENNPWLLKRDIREGDELVITYWVAKN